MKRAARRALLFAIWAPAAGAQGATLIDFNSEPGDSIGQGQQFTLTRADGTFSASRTGGWSPRRLQRFDLVGSVLRASVGGP